MSRPERHDRDPWRRAPTSELQDQVLPRWFVLLGLVALPVAVAAAVGAVIAFRPVEVPVAARRPPAAGAALVHDVGRFATGAADPVVFDAGCAQLARMRTAGTELDRAALGEGLRVLCDVDLDADALTAVVAFAAPGGVVRFAQFQATGVDSTGDPAGRAILVNAKFAQTDPTWIAPLVVHDAVRLAGDPAADLASEELAARRAEASACTQLFADRRPSRGCDDAAALLALPNPLAALEAAGYR